MRVHSSSFSPLRHMSSLALLPEVATQLFGKGQWRLFSFCGPDPEMLELVHSVVTQAHPLLPRVGVLFSVGVPCRASRVRVGSREGQCMAPSLLCYRLAFPPCATDGEWEAEAVISSFRGNMYTWRVWAADKESEPPLLPPPAAIAMHT